MFAALACLDVLAADNGITPDGRTRHPEWIWCDDFEVDDAYEENDTWGAAYDISGDRQQWLSTVSGAAIQADDDWYRINVLSGYENVVVECQFTGADGNIDIALYDASGNTFTPVSGSRTSTSSTADVEHIDCVVPAAGTYYIRVFYGNAGNIYDLWWDDICANHSPTDVALSSTTHPENQPSGTTIGTLLTSDPDPGDTFSYALVSGAGSTDNDCFTIVGNQLKSATSFDYETRSSYSIRVRTTDSGGLLYEEVLVISVIDVDERPVFTGLQVVEGTNIVLRWTSAPNNKYSVCSCICLLNAFSVVRSNIVATPPENTYTDSIDSCAQKFWQIILEK